MCRSIFPIDKRKIQNYRGSSKQVAKQISRLLWLRCERQRFLSVLLQGGCAAIDYGQSFRCSIIPVAEDLHLPGDERLSQYR